MELQPRDLAILKTIGELGTADTKIIHGLYFPNDNTGRSCQNRLKKLADAGLLRPIRLMAVDGYGTSKDPGQTQQLPGGSSSTVHFLTNAGGDLVERETGVLPPRVTRSEPKQLTLRHRIEVVRARLAIDAAAESNSIPAPEWIMEQDQARRSKAAKGRSPNSDQILNDRFFDDASERAVAFRPDASFHLRVPRPSGEGFKSLLGYIELDRSTEGHQQWEGKLLGIDAFFHDTKAWRRHWPNITDPAVVLFVICKTDERVANLAQTTRSFAVASKTRFSTYPLAPETVLTDKVWQDCQGQPFAIIKGR